MIYTHAYATKVLGLDLPLQEGLLYRSKIIDLIISEQMSMSSFFDSIKKTYEAGVDKLSKWSSAVTDFGGDLKAIGATMYTAVQDTTGETLSNMIAAAKALFDAIVDPYRDIFVPFAKAIKAKKEKILEKIPQIVRTGIVKIADWLSSALSYMKKLKAGYKDFATAMGITSVMAYIHSKFPITDALISSFSTAFQTTQKDVLVRGTVSALQGVYAVFIQTFPINFWEWAKQGLISTTAPKYFATLAAAGTFGAWAAVIVEFGVSVAIIVSVFNAVAKKIKGNPKDVITERYSLSSVLL